MRQPGRWKFNVPIGCSTNGNPCMRENSTFSSATPGSPVDRLALAAPVTASRPHANALQKYPYPYSDPRSGLAPPPFLDPVLRSGRGVMQTHAQHICLRPAWLSYWSQVWIASGTVHSTRRGVRHYLNRVSWHLSSVPYRPCTFASLGPKV